MQKVARCRVVGPLAAHEGGVTGGGAAARVYPVLGRVAGMAGKSAQ